MLPFGPSINFCFIRGAQGYDAIFLMAMRKRTVKLLTRDADAA